MFDDMKYVSGSSFCRARKLFGKLNKSSHKGYFYMLYFADRFDEVPNGDILCIINHLCFPSKQIPQDRASKMTIKNSVYITFSRTVCKREFLQ